MSMTAAGRVSSFSTGEAAASIEEAALAGRFISLGVLSAFYSCINSRESRARSASRKSKAPEFIRLPLSLLILLGRPVRKNQTKT